MFILIPLIIIFFAFAYLYLNEDVSIYIQIIVYMFIVLVTIVSIYLAKLVKDDIHQQELNNIRIEIDKLKHRLTTTVDEQQKRGILNEIEILTKEYNSTD